MQDKHSEEEKRILAGRIAGHASLENVRILKSNFELSAIPDRTESGVDVNQAVQIGGAYDPDDEILQITGDFSIKMTQVADEEFIEISSLSFSVLGIFSVPDDSQELSDEAIEAFATTSGLFALYPFAREYVQSVTVRMGLPPLTLDLIKIS